MSGSHSEWALDGISSLSAAGPPPALSTSASQRTALPNMNVLSTFYILALAMQHAAASPTGIPSTSLVVPLTKRDPVINKRTSTTSAATYWV